MATAVSWRCTGIYDQKRGYDRWLNSQVAPPTMTARLTLCVSIFPQQVTSHGRKTKPSSDAETGVGQRRCRVPRVRTLLYFFSNPQEGEECGYDFTHSLCCKRSHVPTPAITHTVPREPVPKLMAEAVLPHLCLRWVRRVGLVLLAMLPTC